MAFSIMENWMAAVNPTPDLHTRIQRDISHSVFTTTPQDTEPDSTALEENLNSTHHYQHPGLENGSQVYPHFEGEEYIFDRTDVRAIFLVLYTIVFCSCFFGNLMVILVVTLHWRMRSITNFCLANLAFADLCVGIFCVYQNIVTYLMDSWIFGEFMCKMYHFINSLSTTASVLILVVICIERYLAIIHPMTCKQMLTLNRLRVTIVFVWILSAAISSPRFYYFRTLSMPLPNDQYEILCVPNRLKYDSKLMDMLSMTGLFLIPLGIISVLYTQIGIVLWKTSNTKMPAASASVESSSSSGYYRDTDNHIIQTVNLTLLPVTDQVQQHGPHCCRPSTLHGVTSLSSSSPPGSQTEKRSFLTSRLNCLRKSKKGGKQCKKNICSRQDQCGGGRPCRVISGAGMENQISAGCGCHHPEQINGHKHHSHLQYGSSSLDKSFEHDCCQDNGSCMNIPGNPGEVAVIDSEAGERNPPREDGSNSPLTTTCCGVPQNCLHSSRKSDKSVTFSTPPSPYCSRSCLEGKSSKTDPIVLVKFERNKSKKGKRSHCKIIMNGRKSSPKDKVAEICVNPDSDEFNELSGGEHPAPSPRYGCNICHPRGNEDGIKCPTCGNAIPRELLILQGCAGDNASLDSGVSETAPARTDKDNFDRYPGPATSGGGQCLCRQSSSESYQVLKCHHHHLPTIPCSPKPPSLVSGGMIPPTTKRLRRMRVVRSSKYGSGALQSRRRIIRMLIVVVLTFAICHLPLHARKVWQYWSPKWAPYQVGSAFSTLFTPITFLIMYANSGINPILYAFMSKKFRMSFKDLLCCKVKHSLRISRNASVRSTHAVALSQTGC